jgi:hypothetical protein
LFGSLILVGLMALVCTLWLGHWLAGLIAGLIIFAVFRIIGVHMLLDGVYQQGLRRARRGQIDHALLSFQRAEAFWARLPWLDRHRSWLLASSSRFGYRDRARFNRIGCLIHLGRREEAGVLLEELLQWCPGMLGARRLQERLKGEEPGADWSSLVEM